MAKINCFKVSNTGLNYVVSNHGVTLCFFNTKRDANARAFELCREFGGSLSLCR